MPPPAPESVAVCLPGTGAATSADAATLAAVPSWRSRLQTPAGRRMAALSGSVLFSGLCFSAMDVVLPLWATDELGFTAAQWASLRSLRFVGVAVGVVALGAISDRFGQRVMGTLSLLGGAAVTLLLALGMRQGIWMAMPALGALVSTAFVNMNALVQQVSSRRQGLANSIYRGIAASTGIVAPIAATTLAAALGGYRGVFGVMVALLIAAAAVLWRHPREAPPPPLGSLRAELALLWGGYAQAMRQKQLMWFMNLSMLWGTVLGGVGAFAAIRFARELGQGDRFFGVLSGAAGLVTVAAMLGGVFFLDRCRLTTIYALLAAVSSAASLVMGLSDSVWLSAAGFLVFTPLSTFLLLPMSM